MQFVLFQNRYTNVIRSINNTLYSKHIYTYRPTASLAGWGWVFVTLLRPCTVTHGLGGTILKHPSWNRLPEGIINTVQ